MYHLGTPFFSMLHVALGFHVQSPPPPSFAMVVALKSNSPNRHVLNKLIVIYAFFTIQHHRYIGKLLSTDAIPATKLFLKVRIEHSAAFIL